jgi:hypothetical protein
MGCTGHGLEMIWAGRELGTGWAGLCMVWNGLGMCWAGYELGSAGQGLFMGLAGVVMGSA